MVGYAVPQPQGPPQPREQHDHRTVRRRADRRPRPLRHQGPPMMDREYLTRLAGSGNPRLAKAAQELLDETVPVVPTVPFSNHNPGRAMDFNVADLRPFYEQIGRTVRELTDLFTKVFDGVPPAVRRLRDAGMIALDPGEEYDSPRERALQLVRNRNTGPARPSGPTARRPRRHQ